MLSSRSCSSRERLGIDEAEHLDLVELVHAEDAARVLAGGARLAAEAGREAGVAARQRLAVEDLPCVQRGQRDLGGPGEVEVVIGQLVDLLLGVGQEAGAVERLLADEDGRDHRLEALLGEVVHDPGDERELQPREAAAQVCEARARQARPALHVDALAGEREVVADLVVRHPGLADLLDDGVLRAPPTPRASWAAARAPGSARRRPARAPRSAPWPHRRPRASSRSPRRRPRRTSWPPRSPDWRRSARRAAPRGAAGSPGGGHRAPAPGPGRRRRTPRGAPKRHARRRDRDG